MREPRASAGGGSAIFARGVARAAMLLLALFAAMQAAQAQVTFTGVQTTLGSGFVTPSGVAIDGSGNVYVGDYGNNEVKEILAVNGSIPTNPTINVLGSGFNGPRGVAVDTNGNVYVADSGNNAVKEILAVGGYTTVNTLGSGFSGPDGVAVDGAGNVFVADTVNSKVKEILAAGGYTTVNTLAAGFQFPNSVVVDGSGNVFVTDTAHNEVKEILAAGGYTTVNVLGSGFSFPHGVAVDGSGNVYVGDFENNAVKEIVAAGGYTTVNVLGSGFEGPNGVAVDGHGNVYVADSGNNRIEELSLTSVNFGAEAVGTTSAAISLPFTIDAGTTVGSIAVLTTGVAGLDYLPNTVSCPLGTYTATTNCAVSVTFTPLAPGARNGSVEFLNGATVLVSVYVYGTGTGPAVAFSPSTQAILGSGFSFTDGVAVDASGNVFITDANDAVVKEILAAGGYVTIQDLGGGFGQLSAVAVDGSGNVFVTDFTNNAVKEIVAAGGYATINTLGGGFFEPIGVAVDGIGNVFVADTGNNAVKEILAAGGYTSVSILGSGFSQPNYVAVDGSGNVFVTDYANNAVKEILAAGGYSTVQTLGSGFVEPTGIAVDASENVFVADSSNAVKEIMAVGGYANVGTVATGFNLPQGVALDGSGNLFVADHINKRIVEVQRSQPPSLAFGNTNVSTTSASSPLSATVQNVGNTALTVTSLTFSDVIDFAQVAGSGTPEDCTGTIVLAPSVECNLSVSFTPQSAGPLAGTVTLTDNALNAPGTPQAISLSGTGLALAQTITFNPIPGQVVGTSLSLTPFATASSGLAVSFASTTLTVCTVTGTTATTIAAGNCTIEASQAGNAVYAPATPVMQTFTVAARSPTTTTLAVTSGGAPVTTVASGSVITLTATVATGSGPVTAGTVNFCNAAAADCTDINLLGTAQLTAAGTASVSFVPGIGSHSYTAVFVGTSSFATSASAASPLTVTGTFPTTTLFVSSGTPGNYTLTATVGGPGTAGPTGTVSFLDTTNGNIPVATAALGAATPGLNFLNSQTPATGNGPDTGEGPFFVTTGDFNGDGRVDLAIANQNSNSVTILLGNGDGTFTATAGSPPTGAAPAAIAVGDFNGDGKLDLAVANATGNNVTVMLGNGDGTFAIVGASPATGATPHHIVAADFNGDGKLDLAVANSNDNTVTVLLGNGDGTFSSAGAFDAGGTVPEWIAAGDFNGDGIPDLAVANLGAAPGTYYPVGSITTLQGNGDGTFAAAVVQYQPPYTNVSKFNSIVAADFNGDGFIDLAATDYQNGQVIVLTGNGSGTFTQTAETYATGSLPECIVTGDFNGDGKADLATANYGNSSLTVLLGNGDATFTAGPTLATPVPAPTIATADFNGDGLNDLVTANFSNATATVLMAATTTATATANGSPAAGTGTQNVVASYPGDVNYSASVSAPMALIAPPVPTTLFLSATPTSTYSGQPVILTATLNPYMTPGSSTDGETVTFMEGTTILGYGALAGGVATLNLNFLPVGSNSLTASYPGDAIFAATSSDVLHYTVTVATSTTTLAVTSVGTPVTTVASGSVVTLTATLDYPGTTVDLPLTGGVMNFCDATAAACIGPGLVGTAQLVVQSPTVATAALKFVPGIGAHSYEAVFAGTLSFGVSSSAASALTVTGTYPTTTAIAQIGSAGNYTLTATVAGTGSFTQSPTGTVSFLDTNNANFVLGAGALGAATFTQAFGPAAGSPFAVGANPDYVVSGDFNGDGFPDLAVANSAGNTVTILLGSANGSFTAASGSPIAVGVEPLYIAVADFNGDGILDLAVANQGDNTISILLGVGNGTFTLAAGSPFFLGNPYAQLYAVAVGDFNGDGIQDLVVCSSEGPGEPGGVSVYLGAGDGTFNTDVGFNNVGTGPMSIAVADFNGDGHPDVAVASSTAGTLSIRLGDGATDAITPPYPYGTITVGGNPTSVVAADFNGDGKIDLAFTNGSVGILLGNGNGSFQTAAFSTVGSDPISVSVGDFNGDGIPDLSVADAVDNTVTVLLGNGDGTFTAQTPISNALYSNLSAATAGDFNGDGLSDLAVASSGDSVVTVLLNQPTQTATAMAIGIPVVGTGPHQVEASYPGDANYGASVSAATPLTAASLATALTLTTPNATTGVPGQQVTVTATLSPYMAQGHTTDGEIIDFQVEGPGVSPPTSYPVALAGGVATLPLTLSGMGQISVGANFPGGDSYFSGSNAPNNVVFTVNPPEATGTTLVVTSAGNAVTTVAPGSVVTLTAAVTAGGAPVTTGMVNFCDATAVYCTDVHLLGSGQLTAAGTAAISLVPGIGSHSYKAIFAGTVANGASSSVATPLTVTGTFPTTATLAATDSAAAYTFTATITGSGSSLSPTGSVAFLDATNGNFSLGTADLGAGTLAQSFAPQVAYGTGLIPQSVAVGDFNGDGIPDLAVANSVGSTVSVLLGNSNGTFQGQVTYATGNYPSCVAVGDFNGDGFPDLAVTNLVDGTVSVLLGSGNGTFRAQVTYPTQSEPASVAVGDFNGDGFPDLAVANAGSPTVSVLLGKGDGTFNPQILAAAGSLLSSVAVGDFNGDGVLDLAVTNAGGNSVGVLLGMGDGAFSPAVSYGTGNNPQSVAVSDFNGDGIPDLAIANYNDNTLSVLLGKGDGTFNAQVTYATGLNPQSVAVGDFNADGIPDLAIADAGGNAISVLLGNADGTFNAQVSYTTGNAPYSAAVGDFNSDGIADLALANNGSNTVSVLLNSLTETATASLVNVSVQGTGMHNIAASYAGDANYAASLSATVPVATVPYPQTAQPAFNPGTGTYAAAQTVMITDATPGATIYYTVDGTIPTTASAVYSLPIPVNTTETLNAIATASNFTTSAVGTATITIIIPPSITTPPANQTIVSGQTATLTVVAAGTAPLTYQWYQGMSPNTTAPVVGGTAASLTTPPLTATTSYWVQVSNASGVPAQSATATVTVVTPPQIISQPQTGISGINPGQTATITVVATGTPPLTYQWFQGMSPITANPIAGAVNSSYTTPPLNVATSYWVQVSNLGGVVDSATVSVYVNQPPVCTLSVVGTSTALAVNATANCSDPQNELFSAETITWGDGTSSPITPSTGTTLMHTYSAAGTYTVVVTATDTSGLTGTAQAQITPNQLPVCTLGVIQGTAATYAVSVTANCTDPQNLTFVTVTINWGDNTVSPATNNSTNTYTYGASGIYAATLTATDTAGLTGVSAPQPVNVLAPAPAIAPGGSAQVGGSTPPTPPAVVGTQVTFICSSVSFVFNGQTVNNALPSQYGISCTSPTITLTPAPTPIDVTIQTTTAPTTAGYRTGDTTRVLCAVVFPLPGLALLLLGTISRGRRRRSRDQWLAIGMVAVLCFGLTSCGGSFTPPPVAATPTGQYYVTISEKVVTSPPPTGFVQTSLIVPLPVSTSAGN